MRYNLQVLAQYVRQSFLEWNAGRSFTFTLVVQAVVPPLIGLAVWTQALPGQDLITLYYAILLFARLLTVSYEHHTFSSRIYSGNLVDDLLRPHPVILAPLGVNLAVRLWHVAMGLPLILVVGVLIPVRPELGSLLMALPALLLAAALQFLFTYGLALTAFWTEKAFGVVGIGQTLIFLLGGEAFPAWLAPSDLKPLMTLLPFRYMLGFPAEIAAGQVAGPELLVGYGAQLAWVGLMGLAVAAIWRSGVRRYTAVGG